MRWKRKRDWLLDQHKRDLVGEWRGGIRPPRELREEKTLAAALPAVLKGLKLEEAVAGEEVLAAWHSVVGELRARYSRPDRLKNGILYVNVIQPTVRFEMEGIKGQFLESLQERFGKKTVRAIELRHGS